MSVTSVSPATGQVIARYEHHTEREIERRLERSARAFDEWGAEGFAERANHLRSAAARLREQLSSLAELIAAEMGKPLAQGKAEVEKCCWVCEHYADNAQSLLDPVTIGTDAQMSRVVYRPFGAVLALMPWNFPFWQLFRFAAPTLMAGNVAVLRHASNVTGCALAIEKLFQESGLPLSVVITDKDQVPRLIDDSRIKAVTLTGSAGAGRAVASAAGQRNQEDRVGARWQRSLFDPAGCRSRARRRALRDEPVGQLGAKLHRGEAIHRRSASA